VPSEAGRADPPPRRPPTADAGRPVPRDAFRLARRWLLDGQRLDMQALAAQLGVNRVTLYRWVGSREQLLVEVLWSLTDRTITTTWAQLAASAGPRVPDVLRHWLRVTLDQPGVSRFLHGESEFAMRLLTLRSGGFQPRLLGLIRRLIVEDIEDGRVVTPLPVDELAFTVLRICESYVYLPAITGEVPDPDMLARVLRVLLSPS
jgi:AcrR family transcriptional regulator